MVGWFYNKYTYNKFSIYHDKKCIKISMNKSIYCCASGSNQKQKKNIAFILNAPDTYSLFNLTCSLTNNLN